MIGVEIQDFQELKSPNRKLQSKIYMLVRVRFGRKPRYVGKLWKAYKIMEHHQKCGLQKCLGVFSHIQDIERHEQMKNMCPYIFWKCYHFLEICSRIWDIDVSILGSTLTNKYRTC